VLGGTRCFGAHRGRRGAGHIMGAARLQLVCFRLCLLLAVKHMHFYRAKTLLDILLAMLSECFVFNGLHILVACSVNLLIYQLYCVHWNCLT